MSDQLTDEQIAEFEEAFTLFDKNSDGTILNSDLTSVLKALGQNPTADEVQDMINKLDEHGNGTIDFPDFLSTMAKRLLQDWGDSEEEIAEVFRPYDKENTGFISVADLRHAVDSLGEKWTDAEFDEMVQEVGVNAEGKVDYNEMIKTQMSK